MIIQSDTRYFTILFIGGVKIFDKKVPKEKIS